VLVVCCLAALALPAHALADPSRATATPSSGAAPLAVTLSADESAGSYLWDLGDGTFASGQTVQHVYAAGDWTATVTAGGQATSVAIHAEAVSLAAPARGRYGRRAVFTGTVTPGVAGEPVTLDAAGHTVAEGITAADGSFRLVVPKLAAPGPYVARTALADSAQARVLVRPVLEATLAGTPLAGSRLELLTRLRPAGAGTIRVRIWRHGKLVAQPARGGPGQFRLPAAAPGALRIEVSSLPADGYLSARTELTSVVVQRQLAFGARGPSVRVLEQRLAAMSYALRGVDGSFGPDTVDAVLAFQKVHGLARTGRVDRTLWPRIFHSSTPAARYRGNHVEVDKARQVLFEVRGGKVVLVVPVSTGATGNTPLGVWHVYRRVPGFDWVLYYPTYFLRGFAIHGYPSVPAYPASHGCVRVPMWVAPRLYAMDTYGGTIYVYL
jgi:L,D-transpeptidase catalytic domain/Putative peptidoglycan binding domain/PKD domain